MEFEKYVYIDGFLKLGHNCFNQSRLGFLSKKCWYKKIPTTVLQKILAGENFGKLFGEENFGRYKPSLYSFFRYYKQLVDKTLANS